ncbi:MAG: hypothetical protein Kow0080_01090 [Candidatus Promineifilaceae bacterium]
MSRIFPQNGRYQHFILLLWQERNGRGTWRISLLDPQKEVRIGFNNLDDLVRYLEQWMTTSFDQSDTNKGENS